MSLWHCQKCGALTGGSIGAPRCAGCGSLDVAYALVGLQPQTTSVSGVSVRIPDVSPQPDALKEIEAALAKITIPYMAIGESTEHMIMRQRDSEEAKRIIVNLAPALIERCKTAEIERQNFADLYRKDMAAMLERAEQAESRVTALEQQACRCAYCGEAVTGALNAFTGEGHERLIDHILACDKRPEMRAFEQIQALEARNAALEARWEQMRDYLKTEWLLCDEATQDAAAAAFHKLASLERPTEDAQKTHVDECDKQSTSGKCICPDAQKGDEE